MKKRTTIQIPKEVRDALKKKKIFRETYADTIKRLMKDKKKLK